MLARHEVKTPLMPRSLSMKCLRTQLAAGPEWLCYLFTVRIGWERAVSVIEDVMFRQHRRHSRRRNEPPWQDDLHLSGQANRYQEQSIRVNVAIGWLGEALSAPSSRQTS